MYSALNVGFTLGSLLGGVALAFDSNTLLRGIPWFTTLAFLVNALAILRLPNAPHDDRTPQERKVKLPGPGPLRNLGWMASTFFIGVLWTNQVLLNIVIPLWLVQETDAPRVLLAFLFGTNTVMCIFLPMAAARGVRDVTTALRAIRVSMTFFVVSCLITVYTHDTVGWVTIALVWLGHVTVTGAELYLSAASWSFEAELMDPRRRGEYQGAAELSGTLGRVWAPALYTFLAMTWGLVGWLVIAAIVVVATVGLHPSARRAQRFLREHGRGSQRPRRRRRAGDTGARRRPQPRWPRPPAGSAPRPRPTHLDPAAGPRQVRRARRPLAVVRVDRRCHPAGRRVRSAFAAQEPTSGRCPATPPTPRRTAGWSALRTRPRTRSGRPRHRP